MESYALDAIDSSGNNMDKAKKGTKSEAGKFIEASSDCRVEAHQSVGLGTDCRLDADQSTGFALTHEKRSCTCHCLQKTLKTADKPPALE